MVVFQNEQLLPSTSPHAAKNAHRKLRHQRKTFIPIDLSDSVLLDTILVVASSKHVCKQKRMVRATSLTPLNNNNKCIGNSPNEDAINQYIHLSNQCGVILAQLKICHAISTSTSHWYRNLKDTSNISNRHFSTVANYKSNHFFHFEPGRRKPYHKGLNLYSLFLTIVDI